MPISRIDALKIGLHAFTIACIIALGTFFYFVAVSIVLEQVRHENKEAQAYLYGRLDELALNVAALRSETPAPINIPPSKVVVVVAPTQKPTTPKPQPTPTPEPTPRPGGLIPFFTGGGSDH